MNTRILFVDGKRMPQGLFEIRAIGGGLLLVLLPEDQREKMPIKSFLAIDEYNIGRLQTRYELVLADAKDKDVQKNVFKRDGKEVAAIAYKLSPVSTDSFTK